MPLKPNILLYIESQMLACWKFEEDILFQKTLNEDISWTSFHYEAHVSSKLAKLLPQLPE